MTPRPPPSSPEDVAIAGVDRARCALPGLGRAWCTLPGFFFFFFFFFLASSFIRYVLLVDSFVYKGYKLSPKDSIFMWLPRGKICHIRCDQTMKIEHLRLDLLAKIESHKLEMLVNNIV